MEDSTNPSNTNNQLPQQPTAQPNMAQPGNQLPPQPQPLTPTPEPSFQPMPPSSQPKKSKLPLIIGLMVALLAIGGGLYYFMSSGQKAPSNDKKQSQQANNKAESKYAGVLNKINKEFKEFDVTEDTAAHSLELYKDKDWTSFMYLSIDDSKDYSHVKSTHFKRYQFRDNMDKYTVHADTVCTDFEQDYKAQMTSIEAYFKEAGYTIENNKFYSQYQNCGIDRIMISDQDQCSVQLEMDTDSTGKHKTGYGSSAEVAGMEIGCMTNEEAASNIEKALQVKQINTDTDSKRYPSREGEEGRIIIQPDYIKPSQTPGYTIASIGGNFGAGAPYYYYKKDGDKWVQYDEEIGLNCAIVESSPEAKAAFKGEKCFVPSSSSDGSESQERVVE